MSKSPEFTSQDAQPFLPEKLIESQDSNATTKQIRIYHALNFIAATGIMITIGLSVVLAALIFICAVVIDMNYLWFMIVLMFWTPIGLTITAVLYIVIYIPSTVFITIIFCRKKLDIVELSTCDKVSLVLANVIALLSVMWLIGFVYISCVNYNQCLI